VGWWGTVLGGAFGFLLGGPLGALLGAALGRRFDKGIDRFSLPGADPGDQERVQTAFFTATFAVMGHLAKVDGQVSRDEIRLAESVMTRMQLDADMRRTAIGLFNEGKAPGFDLDAVLDQFRRECHGRRHLLQMFIEIQLHACYADGALHAEEARVLRHICDRLGFSRQEFAHLEALVRAARTFAGAGAGAGAGLAPTEAIRSIGAGAGSTDSGAPGDWSRRSTDWSSTLLGGLGELSAPARAMVPKPAPRTAPPATAAFQVSAFRMTGFLSCPGVSG